MGTSSDVHIGYANIEVDGDDLGYTQGGVSISRPREYENIIVPGSVGIYGKRKLRESVIIETALLESTLANLQAAWDVDSYTGDVEGENEDVNYHSVKITVPDKDPEEAPLATYEFDRCVFVGEGRVTYARDSATIVPVTIEVMLGYDESAVSPSLDGTDLDGLVYRVNRVKRYSEMQTFGGLRITGAPEVYDIMIEFDIPNATLSMKTALETSFDSSGIDTVAFYGYFDEAWNVRFLVLDPPEPRDALFFLSGSLRVVSEVGS
jgi:hypothetical protein